MTRILGVLVSMAIASFSVRPPAAGMPCNCRSVSSSSTIASTSSITSTNAEALFDVLLTQYPFILSGRYHAFDGPQTQAEENFVHIGQGQVLVRLYGILARPGILQG